jgi:hypothetical protein
MNFLGSWRGLARGWKPLGRILRNTPLKEKIEMTPQEAQMLQDLVRKVEGTQLTEKDPDAEALLNDGLSRDPDALYKLAQTVLIQNIALEQARGQMQRMQQQLAPPQPPRATSFLGGLILISRSMLRLRLRSIRPRRPTIRLRRGMPAAMGPAAADFCVRRRPPRRAWPAACWLLRESSR